MKIYLVGGAVRDELLGLPVTERDWVVVGSTPQEMVDLGYRPVGKDFPVFLHPVTAEEYALARTERKTAPGYKGFTVHADPGVTLREDLLRRDLTINALARDHDGTIIDYQGGRQDIETRLLRHTSPAFVEDPVRVLRVARFAARFRKLGFRVADETMDLMRRMVEAGETDALVPERVWQELLKALMEDTPAEFFEVLRACGALAVIFPEIDRLWGIPQSKVYHPEVDTGVHTMMVLEQAARLSTKPEVRFAALTHDLGKGATPRAEWPKHHGHEERGAALVENLCARIRVPNSFRNLAVITARYHLHAHRALELRPATMLSLFESLDAFRRPARFHEYLVTCEADHRGREGLENAPYPQAEILERCHVTAARVDPKPIVAAGVRGGAVMSALRERRLELITTAIAANRT